MTTYSDVFYRRSLAGNTNITALTLQGNASVPALTVTGGSIYANSSALQCNNATVGNILTVPTGGTYAFPTIRTSDGTGLYFPAAGGINFTQQSTTNLLTLSTPSSNFIYDLNVSGNLSVSSVNKYIISNSLISGQALVVASGNVIANSVTTLAELAQLSGIGATSVISQLNAKASLSGATFTGPVTLSTLSGPVYANASLVQANTVTVGNTLTVSGITTHSAAVYANASLVQANTVTVGNTMTLSAVPAWYALVTTTGNVVTSSSVLANELAQLQGIGATSVISQLNAKANLSGGTFTGAVTTPALTATGATTLQGGLAVSGGNSTFASGYTTTFNGGAIFTGSTTLGSSVVLASPTTFGTGTATFTNAVTASSNLSVGGDLTVTGNLTISGLTTTVNTTQLTVADPVLVVNSGGLASPAGMYIGSGTNGANVVVAYNPTSKFIEMYKTSSNSTTNTFTNTGYANLRASALTLDNTAVGASGIALSLMGGVAGDQGTGIGAYSTTGSGINYTTISFTANGSTLASIYGPDPFSNATGDLGGLYVNGTLSGQDMLFGNVNANSTVLIRSCDNGAFDGKSSTHSISIQGAILKVNPAIYGTGNSIIGTQAAAAFNNIMGTLYVSTSNLMTGANAKAGHATISVLKLAGAAEMDVMPVAVHQSTLCNVFTVGKSSDNANVVISTDPDCAITWQFYGSAF